MSETTEYEHILTGWEDEWRVFRIRLHSPPGHILDRALVAELHQAAEVAAQVAECSLILFEGTGENFSYGASIQEHRPPVVSELLSDFHDLLRFLLDLDIPLAAMVRGRCLGGGLELAAACDFVFAAEDAELGFPEIKLGVFAPAASALLPHKIGANRASSLLLTGHSITAQEAHDQGLVTQVHSAVRLEAAFEHWLRASLLNLSSSSLRIATKAARLAWKDRFLHDLAELEALYLQELQEQPDSREGIDAFLAKRPPVWSHRSV